MRANLVTPGGQLSQVGITPSTVLGTWSYVVADSTTLQKYRVRRGTGSCREVGDVGYICRVAIYVCTSYLIRYIGMYGIRIDTA
jgi:hypothetical protein